MGRASDAQHSFSGGEWSPLLKGRQDLEKYKTGLATCLNAVPLAQGPWTRRPGVEFIETVYRDAYASRLFPFEYSSTQSYVIEISALNGRMRYYTDGGILMRTETTVTGITQANPGVVTMGSAPFANGDVIRMHTMVGMHQLEGREFIVAGTSGNTFQLTDRNTGAAVSTVAYGAFVSGKVSNIAFNAAPYTAAQLPNVHMAAQSADVGYFTHPQVAPQALTRSTATQFIMNTFGNIDGPYMSINATATTLTPSGATGSVTLTASSTTGINNDTGFQTTDVGRWVRLKEGSVWGWAKITARASTTVVTVTVYSTLTNTNAKLTWRLGLWSDTTGWPTTAAFHEDRLWFGGVAAAPTRVDGSKSGDYITFSPSATDGTVANDNAIAYTLNASGQNAVQWMESDEKGLIVGTTRNEWMMRPSINGEALTPVNVTAKPSTNRGSASIRAVRAGSTILFVQRGGRKLRELAWVFEKDSFRAPDMTLISEHITNPGIIDLAYQNQPQEISWAARSDGVLLGFTYERDQNVTAWHRHELGGRSDAADTLIPVVESIAPMTSTDGSREELWMVVKRYINGSVVRHIERMTKLWEEGDLKEDAFFLDCGLTKTAASPTVTFGGLYHLEGETVTVLADGAVHPDVAITNGTATLETASSKVTVGYAYPSDGLSLPIEAGSQDGTAQGKTKRISRVGFILQDTLGFRYGPDADTLQEVLATQWGETFGEATELYSGVFRGSLDGDYDRTGQVFWRCDGPFPATLLAYLPQVDTSDDS